MAKIEARSEVTGIIAKIEASAGDRLEAGSTVLFVESMKMQIPVVVDDPATLKQVLVAVGDTVSEGQVVAVLES
ncbi:MAG TPA: acetyl-CoA carboxylase biotin carboxyl carrier protein subunit [Hyphomicrobiaceae bacterium]|nr:acetyl-CoA carboxylase biotin carboxyl carrier protein subunit [Hyphomicrobiaceae bacterium]